MNNNHPSKQDIIRRKKRIKRKRINALIKLFLTLLFIILLGYLLILGYETFIKENKEEKPKENNNQQEEKEETPKYEKELDEKLKKLDYVNEKIDYFKMDYLDRYIAYKEKNPDLSNEKIVLYVNIGIDNDFYTNIQASPNQHTNTILLNKYYAIDSNFKPQNLKDIDPKYRGKYLQMTEEAADAFNSMAKDAKEQGYTIRAVSTYRSYSYQNNLYNNYVKADGKTKADTYSARPGHSEHHTGLAVDVDNANLSYTSFGKTKEFTWMKENAYKYGYILRYTTENEFITGYKNEPWHYRYVGIKIATEMKEKNIGSYEEYYFMYLDK